MNNERLRFPLRNGTDPIFIIIGLAKELG